MNDNVRDDIKLLSDLELKTKLNQTQCAKLLGIVYVTYSQYKSGYREMQNYLRYSVENLLELPQANLEMLIRRRVFKEFVSGRRGSR